MNFHRYVSTYETMVARDAGRPTWDKFYKEVHREMAIVTAQDQSSTNVLAFNHMIAEELWYEGGKPYYKIWPKMVDTFIFTSLDVPVSLLRAPHPSFAIYLPTEPILDFDFDNQHYAVSTILVLIQDEAAVIKNLLPVRIQQRNVHLWIDIGEKYRGTPLFTWRHGKFDTDSTIEAGFANLPTAWETMEGVIVPRDITEACVRLAVATCFLACGGERVIERDILSKHIDEYRRTETPPDRKRVIEAKAARLGQGGWHIGRGRSERELHLKKGVSYSEALKQAGGRSLLFQHVRGGHFRRVRFGPGKLQYRVQFFDDITVRPDLPPKPITR